MPNKIKTLFSAFLFIVSHGANSGVAIYDSLDKTVPSLINIKDKNMLETATIYQNQETQPNNAKNTHHHHPIFISLSISLQQHRQQHKKQY
jgi:hypothetical protein